jgi:hypothetical protein
MPPSAFTLQIPADTTYAEVAADAARKFVELMGGDALEAGAFSGAVATAVRTVLGAGSRATCVFSLQSTGVEVVVSSGAGSASVVRQPIAAPRAES